jgi:hypothetical protein
MRWILACAASLTFAGAAVAEEPVNPYQEAAPAPPEVAPPADVTPNEPINPYGTQEAPPPLYPPPSTYGYQPPSPGQYNSTPPSYQQGYYLYANPGQPPVYYAPPPTVYVRPRLSCTQLCGARGPRKWDGVRRFALGIHGDVLWVGQKVGDSDVVLGGAGFHLRLRSKGHFGVEFSQSFLHASYWNGGFERNSYPFMISLMGYVFKNEDSRHFNIYFGGGVGVMPDTVKVRFSPDDYRSQDFLEWMLHVAVGAELRFKWFAIDADVRGLAMVLDKTDFPARYYEGVQGGPIPDSSWGIQGKVSLNIWF